MSSSAAEPLEAPITRQQLFEILEDFITRAELRIIADVQATATANGVLIRAIMKALIDNGVLTEQQIQDAKPS